MTATLSNSQAIHTNLQGPVKLYRMSMPEHECPWGLRAVNLLNEKGIAFEDIKLTSQAEAAAFKAQHDVATTPQIFFGDRSPISFPFHDRLSNLKT